MGHRSLSYRILVVICSRSVSSIDTPGCSTTQPSSMVELGVHKKRPASWVDSYQRKEFSLGVKVSSCMSSVGYTEVGLVVKAIRVHTQMWYGIAWCLCLASLWARCVTSCEVPGVC